MLGGFGVDIMEKGAGGVASYGEYAVLLIHESTETLEHRNTQIHFSNDDRWSITF